MEGTAFGHYRLLDLLGRGGMGEVWRAHDTSLNRVVAIKVLPSHLAENHDFVQRFRREAHAVARLNNPHVIPIHQHGEIDGRLFLDMRLVEGRNLANLIADGPLDPTLAVLIIGQVAKALHAAHSVGLLHRDVKPSNVLLDDDFAYLIDFGIARGADDAALTMPGAVLGTWHYMAPERWVGGQAVDARSDVYSLACVLYETLTGRHPFPGDTIERQIGAHLTARPPTPSLDNLRVPVGFDAVIAAGMHKSPDARYPTTVALAAAARDALTVRQPPPSVVAPRRAPAPPARQPRRTLSRLALRYAARSDRGLVAASNEDSVFAGPWLLAVSDGMSDRPGGNVASQLIVAALCHLDEEEPRGDLLSQLNDAVHQGNAAIAGQVGIEPELTGMGATITAMLFGGNRIGLAHIGDSRGYLLRGAELRQITKDDTFVQTLVDEGRITAEEAHSHPQRALLVRALTGHAVEPTLTMREALVGDRYLLCSDGLSDPVSFETIQDVLLIPDVEAAADKLIEMALRGGGPGNVSVIVADVVDNGGAQSLPIFGGAVSGEGPC
jgi:serine/threonine protein phosphatase PrpC